MQVVRNTLRMAGKPESFSEEENKVLRDALRKFAVDNKLTQAAVGRALDIAQQNAGRLTGSSPFVGMGRKTANLLAVKLGYRDAEHFLKERGVLAELQAPREGAEWGDRDSAARIAKHLNIDETAIRNVVARYSRNEDHHRPMKWWIGKFREEEVEMAADAQAPALPVAIRPATKPPSRSPKKREGTNG